MKISTSFIGQSIMTGLILSLILSFASCSNSNSGNTSELLSTIPSDVSVVATIDLEDILEDMGCKVDDSSIKISNELQAVLNSSHHGELSKIIEDIKDGGVHPSVVALFIEGYNSYMTGFLSDTEAFKQKISKEFNEEFETEGELATCGNVAVVGNRFWISLSSRNSIVSSDIKHFISLSEKQSLISNKTAVETLEDQDHDITVWGDIKGCLNAAQLDFAVKGATNMAIEGAFADASYIVAGADFDKGKLSAEMTVLNSKGGIAKFLFPTGKIQAETIRKMGVASDAIFATAITHDMIKLLKENTQSQGFSMIGLAANLMSCIDGTCAAATDIDGNIAGVFSTSGNDVAALSEALSQYGFKVTKDSNLLRFSQGAPTSGDLSAEDAASELKGNAAGVYISGHLLKDYSDGKISSIVATLSPEKGGLSLKLTISSTNPKENILTTLIRD